jgi:hypothetical protein
VIDLEFSQPGVPERHDGYIVPASDKLAAKASDMLLRAADKRVIEFRDHQDTHG